MMKRIDLLSALVVDRGIFTQSLRERMMPKSRDMQEHRY